MIENKADSAIGAPAVRPQLPGQLFQACHLVQDIDAAIDHWVRFMGAGPFFLLPKREFAILHHRGVPAERKDIIDSVALGQLGSLQIELIVPGPAPSTYQEFLARGGQGLHHYGYLTDDFDAARTNAMACGMTAVTEGGSQLTRFSYLEAHDAPAGTVVELVEATPAMTAFVATVAQAHEGWDGNQPVRHL